MCWIKLLFATVTYYNKGVYMFDIQQSKTVKSPQYTFDIFMKEASAGKANKKVISKNDDEEEKKCIEKMTQDDEKIEGRITKLNEELKIAFDIDKHELQSEMIRAINDGQIYRDESSKMKVIRHKASRFLEKLHAERYEYFKMGRGGVSLKTQGEFDIYIGKSPKYRQIKSYIDMITILIKNLDVFHS